MNLSSKTTQSEYSITDKVAAYYELTKPGITLTILISMVVGFVLGSGSSVDYLLLLNAVIGTFLIASGTAAHNQFMEWRYDGQMNRTKTRPLPSERISPRAGAIFSVGLMFGGLLYLILVVNFVAGMVSLATSILYLLVYTPLKRVSSINVFVGGIPGALPPVGGWAAATGHLGHWGMWLLFGIAFLWQVPHVMAIAWVANDDYSKAGYRMLPSNDEKGNKTVVRIMVCLLALFPVCWGLYYIGIGHWVYLAGALLSSLVFLYYGVLFARERSKETAKKLMFASFGYLPIVWAFVILDQIIF